MTQSTERYTHEIEDDIHAVLDKIVRCDLRVAIEEGLYEQLKSLVSDGVESGLDCQVDRMLGEYEVLMAAIDEYSVAELEEDIRYLLNSVDQTDRIGYISRDLIDLMDMPQAALIHPDLEDSALALIRELDDGAR